MIDIKSKIMDKKLVGLAAVAVFIFGGIILALSARKVAPMVSSVGEEEEGGELLTWEDQAGFSFLYPEEIAIDSHEEDTENYAYLELTSPDHSGNVQIWVKETDYDDIEAWVEEEVIDANILDTQLAEEPAKKMAYFDPIMIQVAAIDIDALVLLELIPDPNENNYMEEIFDQVLDSFAFIPIEGEEVAAPAGGGEAPAGGSGVIWEAEEVIE